MINLNIFHIKKILYMKQNGDGNGQKMKYQIFNVSALLAIQYWYMMTVLVVQDTQML